MKQIILAVLMSLFIASCQEDFPQVEQTGILKLESIEMIASTEETLSRTIDADLTIEIWQNGKIVEQNGQALRFTNANFPSALYIPAGNYQVKAYNEAYQQRSTWTNEELGSAVYYKEEDVTVKVETVCTIAMQVPMTNIGVTFTLPKGFDQSFSEYSFTVAETGEGAARTVVVTSPQTIYMDAKDFAVTLQAKNVDGETVQTSLTKESVTAGTVYTVTYKVATANQASVLASSIE